MTNLEDRLRRELVELADALLEDEETTFGPIEHHMDAEFAIPALDVQRFASRSDRWRLAAVAASVLAVAGLGYLAVRLNGSEEVVLVDTAAGTPSSFGTWDTIAEAPIDPRPSAATAWTGSEVVFWAGSSLTRGFA